MFLSYGIKEDVTPTRQPREIGFMFGWLIGWLSVREAVRSVGWLVVLFNIIQIILHSSWLVGINDRQTDRQTCVLVLSTGSNNRTTDLAAYRPTDRPNKATKKPKNPTQKAEKRTPQSNFKPFSPTDIFRGMGVLPKKSVYLPKNRYADRHKDS